MNKIIVRDNVLEDFSSENIVISNNSIYFLTSGDYFIEYIGSHKIKLNITLKENITVTLFEYSSLEGLENKITYDIRENSVLRINKFYNNITNDDNVIINLLGENAKIKYMASSLSKDNAKHNIIVNHLNKNTVSDIYYHILALSKASVDVNIDSVLPKGNTNCYLNQETKIITLGDNACMVKPNMYIEEDDVEAKHGSVIGTFNQKDIFYLSSRGLYYKDAVNLLVKGHILANLENGFNFKEKIIDCLNKNGGDICE